MLKSISALSALVLVLIIQEASVTPVIQKPSKLPCGQFGKDSSGEQGREETTTVPTLQSSEEPTVRPTEVTSGEFSGEANTEPSLEPSGEPSAQPSQQQLWGNSGEFSGEANTEPSLEPSGKPSVQLVEEFSGEEKPTLEPSSGPSEQQTIQATDEPNEEVSEEAKTVQPSPQLSGDPSKGSGAIPCKLQGGEPQEDTSGEPILEPTPSETPAVSSKVKSRLLDIVLIL
ncbi:protein TsetseEP-like isoform X2 [Sphaerodactylus townsendi]|uniref:Uncharacterized protein n=1 Tax=Sphaerodactylus townsendi TaxID=933632 RepID=A0ACB8FVA7_9SAUR|nr:protein TsetseEP-like isoform X2 [Sphaerodactylus townsendi]